MSCTSILKAWVISVSIHALVLGGATWVLNEIQAPPPEQVFRWDIALESGSASSADQASEGDPGAAEDHEDDDTSGPSCHPPGCCQGCHNSC